MRPQARMRPDGSIYFGCVLQNFNVLLTPFGCLDLLAKERERCSPVAGQGNRDKRAERRHKDIYARASQRRSNGPRICECRAGSVLAVNK